MSALDSSFSYRIQRVGVVGAGVMGTGIAAHLASAGYDVLLVDIAPKDPSQDRKSTRLNSSH